MKTKKKMNFFSEGHVGKSSDIETPMLTKEEQSMMMKSGKKKTLSLFSTENISPYKPDETFSMYRTIKNSSVPIYKTECEPKIESKKSEVKSEEPERSQQINVEENESNQIPPEPASISPCNYCFRCMKKEESVFIPLQMYDDEDGNRVFEGEGYYHFECAYRVILDELSYASHTAPHIYKEAKLLLQLMFRYNFPNPEVNLIPAPKYKDMHVGWHPKYVLTRQAGCVFRRGMTYYAVEKIKT